MSFKFLPDDNNFEKMIKMCNRRRFMCSYALVVWRFKLVPPISKVLLFLSPSIKRLLIEFNPTSLYACFPAFNTALSKQSRYPRRRVIVIVPYSKHTYM